MHYNKEELVTILPEYIYQKSIQDIRNIFEEYNIVDLAEIFTELDIQQAVFTFRVLPKETSAELFSYLEPSKQQRLIEVLSSHDVYHIMDNLFSDDIVEMLDEMPANVVRKILKSVSVQQRQEINTLLSYDEFSAGSIMSIDFMELHETDTVEQAITKIKQQANLVETINVCYVVDKYRQYEGVVHLRDIIVADNGAAIKDLVQETDIYVYTNTDQEEVVSLIKQHDITAIPVLNNQNRLIGMITADDVLDVLIEEASEDIHKMGGVTHTSGSYIQTTIKEMVSSRLYWLLILMVSASFTGQILQIFEDKLNTVAALAISIPVIMSTAGNAGSQSSATIIRSIVTDNLTLCEHFIAVLKKELVVSVLCGSVIFVVNLMRLMVLPSIDKDFMIALIVSITLVISLLLANVIGGILPLVAQRFKIDPASMAAPIITTIVDAASLVVYFMLASYFLNL